MELDKEIPAILNHKTYSFSVSYNNQAPYCYFCCRMGHFKDCTKLFCTKCSTQGHKESQYPYERNIEMDIIEERIEE